MFLGYDELSVIRNCLYFRYILEKEIGTCTSPKRSLLQIPPRETKQVKSSPGRGSWPGPGTSSNTSGGNLINEFSKSEQHLSTNEPSRYLSACSDSGSRKNSDSYYSDYFNQNIPPSRSEDMLFSIPSSASQTRNRTTTICSISATTSPLLSVKPFYGSSMVSINTLNTTNTSDSMHSLSSDSDSNPQPVDTSTPNKSKTKPRMPYSRSMTNVKQNILDSSMKCDKVRPRYLNIDSHISSNLDSCMSKSLTNIKSYLESDVPASTYLKPVDCVKRTDNSENLFKVPQPDFYLQSTSKEHQSGILQVYAAYETGLASGTSLKVHVTPRTTAREVVDLVIKQLNMAVVLKGKEGPIYSADKMKNFCLVAVIGARERCLRDDFRPLQLQNPWKKGRLYVRQKQDVLAALEQSSKQTTII